MNERIRELLVEARQQTKEGKWHAPTSVWAEKFAELIVKECKENFTKVWYEQGIDIRGAELGKFMKRFEEHFGVER